MLGPEGLCLPLGRETRNLGRQSPGAGVAAGDVGTWLCGSVRWPSPAPGGGDRWDGDSEADQADVHPPPPCWPLTWARRSRSVDPLSVGPGRTRWGAHFPNVAGLNGRLWTCHHVPSPVAGPTGPERVCREEPGVRA